MTLDSHITTIDLQYSCEQCTQKFRRIKYGHNKRFCSEKCRERNCYLRLYAHKHGPISRLCETCGNRYEAKGINRTRQRYCSVKCLIQSPAKIAYGLKRRRSPEGIHYHRNRRLRLMNHLGGPKCSHCDCGDYNILQLDHIDPDHGIEDRRRFGNSGSKMIGYYLKHIDEATNRLRVLCVGCNNARKRKY